MDQRYSLKSGKRARYEQEKTQQTNTASREVVSDLTIKSSGSMRSLPPKIVCPSILPNLLKTWKTPATSQKNVVLSQSTCIIETNELCDTTVRRAVGWNRLATFLFIAT
jgi:hypothetical protein